MWPEKIMSIVFICEIGDRAAHVYIHSGGHKLIENAFINEIDEIAYWRDTDAGRLIHTGNCHLSLSWSNN